MKREKLFVTFDVVNGGVLYFRRWCKMEEKSKPNSVIQFATSAMKSPTDFSYLVFLMRREV